MRYVQIENISFTDINGVEYAIKDIRPIPGYVEQSVVDVTETDKVDEIASRETVYGSGAEDQSYKIFDHNIVKLVETGFDLIRTKRLGIPL